MVLGSELDDDAASRAISQLVLLGAEDPDADIKLYIDSSGGSPSAGLAVHDAMNFVACDVSTWAIGRISSVGLLVLSSGAHGKRYATPTSVITLDQSAASGQSVDVARHQRWIEEVIRLVADQAGQPLERVTRDFQSRLTLTAVEALRYGLIDRIAHEAPGGPRSN